MVGKHVLSVIFLGLVFSNVTQATIFPFLSGFWRQDYFPHFLNLDMPGIGQYSHNLVSSAATATSNAYHKLRGYLGNWQSGLGGFNFSPRLRLLRQRFMNGGILPGVTQPAIINGAVDTAADAFASRVLPENYLRPTLLGRGLLGGGLLGNYGGNLGGVGGVGGGSGAASAAAASAA